MLYLLRHGQTDCTRTSRFCSQHDPPLNAVGLAMAWSFARCYRRPPWRAVYSSPSRRAQETARIAAGTASIALEPALRELDYGSWDDIEQSSVASTPEYLAWVTDPEAHPPPNGETPSAVVARATTALQRLREMHAGEDLLLVTHKAVIRTLVCHYMGIPVRLFRSRVASPVCSLTLLEFAGDEVRLARLCDVAHLPKRWRAAPDRAV